MGIRFLCHHCEKRLNVKSAQAGLQGQCPHCLAKVLVPLQSTVPSELERQLHVRRGKRRSSEFDDSSIGLHAVDEQITSEGIPAGELQLESNPVLKEQRPVSGDDDVGEQPAEFFMLDKPMLPASMGKIDPIAQAPSRVWYFRSRELGERGPLKAKVMQEHLDNGDVCVGCIVWREDWNDWLPAERVFPKLVAQVAKTNPNATPTQVFKEANYVTPAMPDPQAELSNRIRRKNQIFVGAIALGVVIIIVLLVVLLKLVADNP